MDAALRILLVRHGETALTAEHRFQGSSDEGLNTRGQQQAAALANRLADEPLAAIYSSALTRARQTASAIAEAHALLVITDERLGEMCFGNWEGHTYAELRQRYPLGLRYWEHNQLKVAPPGGETLRGFANRVGGALYDLRRAHETGSIVVCAHGGVLKLILCRALGLPPTAYWQFTIQPASVTELSFYNEGGVLTSLNDTQHLREAVWAN